MKKLAVLFLLAGIASSGLAGHCEEYYSDPEGHEHEHDLFKSATYDESTVYMVTRCEYYDAERDHEDEPHPLVMEKLGYKPAMIKGKASGQWKIEYDKNLFIRATCHPRNIRAFYRDPKDCPLHFGR